MSWILISVLFLDEDYKMYDAKSQGWASRHDNNRSARSRGVTRDRVGIVPGGCLWGSGARAPQASRQQRLILQFRGLYNHNQLQKYPDGVVPSVKVSLWRSPPPPHHPFRYLDLFLLNLYVILFKWKFNTDIKRMQVLCS